MAVIVQKFGGTSVADADKIRRAAERAVRTHQAGHQVVMVVSARGKKTDELIRLAAEITDEPPPREMDMLLSTGEQESVALMAMAVQQFGVEAISLTGGQIGVVTDSSYTKARIQSISTVRIVEALDAGQIVIAAGFQGRDAHMNITTLGRGGSDTTATALAAVLGAEACEIYTDVEGVFTTDPRKVSDARRIPQVSYDEMLELASMGAGVMHSRSIEFAKKYNVPIRVRPSHTDGEGTLITQKGADEPHLVTGVALLADEVRVSFRDLPDRPGVLATIFSHMSKERIPVDMVVQDISSGGLAEVTFTVPEPDLAGALKAAEESLADLGAGSVRTGTHVAKVSAVGVGMPAHTGVAAQMFRSLSDAEINIAMVTTSDIKLSVLVDRANSAAALQAVHAGFHLGEERASAPPVGVATTPPERKSASREELEREIVSRLANMEDIVVFSVDLDTEQARLTIGNLTDKAGVLAPIFAAVADAGIVVDMIVQNVSREGQTGVSLTVPQADLSRCEEVVRAVIKDTPGATIDSDASIAILSVQGIGLRSHTGVGERMFGVLARLGVNVQLVNTSETKLSVVVTPSEAETAFAELRETFGV